ncbi:MAG: hypothetical protein WD294_05215 [Phycisphaeraceae bacterium]
MLLLSAIVVGGCAATDPLPRHAWVDADHALALMAERGAKVETLTARCAVAMRSGHEDVTFDGAVVARLPHDLRLRGWKFDRAVIDLTIREDGVWFWTAQQRESLESGSMLDAMNNPRARGTGLAMVIGAMVDGPWHQTEVQGDELTATQMLDSGWQLQATIDRPTLTISRYALIDGDGHVVQQVRLDRYVMVNDMPWPMRIVAEGYGRGGRGSGVGGASGQIVVRLSDVSLNEGLADGAFNPPRRAIRQNGDER